MGNLSTKKYDSVVVGYKDSDDAAIVRDNHGNYIVQTVDFFTPIVDDPYSFGQIAAANSLSDIYAMGGQPLFALNIVGFPINDLPKSILTQILQGGEDKAQEAGIPIVGGHSVDDREPKYGLVVTGEIAKNELWVNSRAKEGDKIILTKPLGTGIISTAIKKNVATDDIIQVAIESMSTLNKYAADILKQVKVHAVTDISGFGLLGHLREICEASKVSAKINFKNLEYLPGTKKLAKDGFVPGGTKRNLDYVRDITRFNNKLTEIDMLLTSDAQTSGGLLICLSEKEAKTFISNVDFPVSIIGDIIKTEETLIFVD